MPGITHVMGPKALPTVASDPQNSTRPGDPVSSNPGDCRATVPKWFAEQTGLLVVGHGTRDPAGVRSFLELTQMTRLRLPGTMLAPAFLEFVEPTIEQGVENLVRAGVTQIVVVPVMLLAGNHTRRDIPNIVDAAVAHCTGVNVRQTAHLGCSPHVVNLSAQRLREAIDGSFPTERSTAVLLVGRGSREREALREISQFAQLSMSNDPETCRDVCFLSLSRPSLDEAIALAASWPQRRIVVQPHLLFPGVLFDRLVRDVGIAERDYPAKQWIVAQPLGPERLLADAVAQLYLSRLGRHSTED